MLGHKLWGWTGTRDGPTELESWEMVCSHRTSSPMSLRKAAGAPTLVLQTPRLGGGSAAEG